MTTPDTTGQEPIATAPAPAADDASTRLAILERELKEARQEAAKYRTERKAQEAAAAAEREKQLAEQGEYKTLAEQRAAEVAKLSGDLDAAKETAKALERYQTAVAGIVAPKLEGLSEQLRKLVSNLDPLAQLEWVAALEPQQQAARPGAPALAPTAPAANRDAPARPQGGWSLSDIYKR